MTRIQKAFLAGAALLALAGPALAHHSFAMFAADKTITMPGTVSEFEWTNPHAWLHVKSTATAGQPSQDWAFEMASPAQLYARGGWKADTVKPGDKVILQMHPMKDGSYGGQYVAVKLPNGQTLGQWKNPS